MLAKGYGHRDVEKGLPVTDKTLMAIGSNSKSFTVTLMGTLSDEKKLEWDKPVREYLPDFQMQNDIATRLMTPTDLVTHRSGLPRHDRMWFATGFSRKEMYDRLRFLDPSATFRQRYQYNNLMFMTAGYLTEKITGDTWENLIKQRIFVPLGMTRSNTSVRDMPVSDDYAQPYVASDRRARRVPFRNIDAIGPAGAINSSVDEMLRYVQMHIDQGSAGGRQIISKRFSALMQSLHSASPVSIDLDAPTYTEFGPGRVRARRQRSQLSRPQARGSRRRHRRVRVGDVMDAARARGRGRPDKRLGRESGTECRCLERVRPAAGAGTDRFPGAGESGAGAE